MFYRYKLIVIFLIIFHMIDNGLWAGITYFLSNNGVIVIKSLSHWNQIACVTAKKPSMVLFTNSQTEPKLDDLYKQFVEVGKKFTPYFHLLIIDRNSLKEFARIMSDNDEQTEYISFHGSSTLLKYTTNVYSSSGLKKFFKDSKRAAEKKYDCYYD